MGYAQGELPQGRAEGELLHQLDRAPRRRTCCSPDPLTGQPLQLNFSTQTYDFEVGDSFRVGHAPGVHRTAATSRRNNFDITIAPAAENRTELGAYVQDEIFFDKVPLHASAAASTSSATSTIRCSRRGWPRSFKPAHDHSLRVSFNRAFRSPSVINNYLDIAIVNPTDLSALAPLLPPRCSRWSRAVSAGRQGGRQPSADRRDAAGRT